MNIMVGTTTIPIIPIWVMVDTMGVTMADTRAGESVWDTVMVDGDLECPGAILPMAGATEDVMDIMIPGAHGDTADIMADPTGVVITMATIMDTGTDTMVVDIITPLHIPTVKWIHALPTDTQDHRGAAQEAPANPESMIPKKPCPEQQARIP